MLKKHVCNGELEHAELYKDEDGKYYLKLLYLCTIDGKMRRLTYPKVRFPIDACTPTLYESYDDLWEHIPHKFALDFPLDFTLECIPDEDGTITKVTELD